MRVSTLFPIAVHSLVLISVFTGDVPPPQELSENFPERKVTSSFISGSTGSNAVIIRNILGDLKKAGFINIAKGRGGTTLNIPSSNISLWDVYSIVEPTEIDSVFKMHANCSPYCSIGSNISELLSPHFIDAFTALKNELSKVMISDIVNSLYEKIIESRK